MDKKDLINKLHQCITLYEKNLRNKNIVFIFENKNSDTLSDSISFIETIFYPHNFLHLTGIEYISNDKKVISKYQIAMEFYRKLLQQKIPFNSIKISNPFIVQLKLSILHHLGNIDKSAKFIGDYNNSKDRLYTQKIVGNIAYCFGFVRDTASETFYVPNSTIKQNIKEITNDTCNIVAIMKKDKNTQLYSSITYLKNGLNLDCLLRNDELANLIDFENIYFAQENDNNNIAKVENYRQELLSIINNGIELNDEENK